MLLEVYRCVQLKRWSVVCGCVPQRGQRGEGWCASSTLCRYDIRMGLLLVPNWARVRRVSLGRESSEGETPGARWCISLLWLRCMRCVCTMLVCICVEFTEICCRVDRVWVCVYVGGVADVVECGLFFKSRCVWVDCQFV